MPRIPVVRKYQRARDVKRYLHDTADFCSLVVEQCRKELAEGGVTVNTREMFRIAADFILRARTAQVAELKVRMTPQNQTLIINSTEKEIKGLPDSELKALAKQILSKDTSTKNED